MNDIFHGKTIERPLLHKLVAVLILGLIPVFACTHKQSNGAGREEYSDEIFENIYPFISTISNGPAIDAELEPGRPNKQGEYSYYFRLVVRAYETWDLVYLERIGIFDEEGIDRKLTRHVFVDLSEVFPETAEGEFRHIESIKWLDDVTSKLVINQREYVLGVNEFIVEK